MKTFLRAFLLTLSFAWLMAGSASAQLPKVLIMGAEQPTWVADIQSKLQATGQFSEVDYVTIPTYSASFPTLATLQGYGSVMIFSDYGMGTGFGSTLASYVDGGGGVVVAMFALGSSYDVSDAAWNNSSYLVITPGSYTDGTAQTLGSVLVPSSPIMTNVTSLNGGISFRTTSTTLNGSSFVVADWSDGTILVAARTGVGVNSKGRRVDLNMFPVSSAAYSSGWVASTQGGLLMANAMTWAAGGGAPPSELNLQPRALNFGTIPPGLPVTYCVTANSVGASNLHIKGVSLSGPSDFTITTIGKNVGDSILAGGSAQYCITFNPTASGTRTGTFTLTTDGRDSGTQVVTLTGNGVLPAVSYGATTLFHSVFTELTDTSQVKYVTVSSTGLGPLAFSSIYFYGLNSNNYFIVHSPRNPLQPGQTDSIGVKFAPTIEGRPDATLVINTNTVGTASDTIPLFGDGILPRLVINNTYSLPSNTPATGTSTTTIVNVSFDSLSIGSDSCMNILLYNPGSDTLAIEKNFFSSADYDFSLTPLTGSDTLILPGASRQVQVCFKPIKQGTRTATLRIATNIPHTFDSPPRDTSGFSVVITGIGVPSGHLAITGPATIGNVDVSKQGCVTDTLWNNGQADITVSGWTITGADSAEFAASGLTFPLDLPAGSSKTFSVCGTPSSDGDQTATLTVNGTNGTEGAPATASSLLDVYGITVCDSLHFVTNFSAATCIGSADTATISVTNCGNVAAAYTASIAGANMAQFAIIGAATSPSEGAGGVATYMVTYTPDTLDATSAASFNIAGGGGSLALSAAHAAATIAGSGTAPTTAVGATSASFPVNVTNTGNCTWDPGSVISAGPFTYVSGSSPIAPAGNINLMFTFTPAAAGSVNQQVTFTNAVGTSLPGPNVMINGVGGTESVPLLSAKDGYSLDQNHPNPFGSTSEIEITLPTDGQVHLVILDITGQVVQNVMDQHENAGSFSVKFNASELASGTYFYQMTCNGETLTRQMSIVK